MQDFLVRQKEIVVFCHNRKQTNWVHLIISKLLSTIFRTLLEAAASLLASYSSIKSFIFLQTCCAKRESFDTHSVIHLPSLSGPVRALALG